MAHFSFLSLDIKKNMAIGRNSANGRHVPSRWGCCDPLCQLLKSTEWYTCHSIEWNGSRKPRLPLSVGSPRRCQDAVSSERRRERSSVPRCALKSCRTRGKPSTFEPGHACSLIYFIRPVCDSAELQMSLFLSCDGQNVILLFPSLNLKRDARLPVRQQPPPTSLSYTATSKRQCVVNSPPWDEVKHIQSVARHSVYYHKCQ